MKKIYLSSLIISLVIGAVVMMVLSLLTATYPQTSPGTGYREVLTGIDAIEASIQAIGFAGYLKGMVGPYIIYVIGLFMGCMLQGVMLKNN